LNLGGRRDDFQLGLAMGDLHRAKGAKGPKEFGFVVDNTMLGFDAVGFGWVRVHWFIDKHNWSGFIGSGL